MDERQVTVEGNTHKLPSPFIVMATQNPIEYEGTFPLPEAQLDRFFLKISLGYPSKQEEIDIVENQKQLHPIENLQEVASDKEITIFVADVLATSIASKQASKAVSEATR